MSEIQNISICITVKNRSALPLNRRQTLALFPNCIQSIKEAVSPEDPVEIVVVDWYSTDINVGEFLQSELKDYNYKVVYANGSFHRSIGRNLAAENASYERLLFLDADMLITRALLEECSKVNKIIFPTCFYFLNATQNMGFWCDGGRGICAINKSDFGLVKGWPAPPDYLLHFDEDQIFFDRIKGCQLDYELKRFKGFYHQFHPGRSVNTILKRRQHLIEHLTEHLE